MYSSDFWCGFMDLVGFFGCYCLTLSLSAFFIMKTVTGVKQKQPKNLTKLMNPHPAKKHRNTSKVSLLSLFYRKISKNNDI